jgi:hypothetical protein
MLQSIPNEKCLHGLLPLLETRLTADAPTADARGEGYRVTLAQVNTRTREEG